MQIDLTKEVADDLTLREGLLMSLGTKHPYRESKILKELANLREGIADSHSANHVISNLEFKYCVNAIKLSDYSKEVKFALLGGLSDHSN